MKVVRRVFLVLYQKEKKIVKNFQTSLNYQVTVMWELGVIVSVSDYLKFFIQSAYIIKT